MTQNPGVLSGYYEPWFFDLCPEQPRRTGNHVPLSPGPGLGITLDKAVKEAHPYVPSGRWSERSI